MRAFLPQQDIVGGVVTVKVVEAKFGKTRTEGDVTTWLTPEKMAAMIAAQQPSGQLASTDRLDRALLLIDDLPGVAASGRLQEGEDPGHTDMVIKPASEPMFSGIAAVDNQGNRSTGDKRVFGNVIAMSPLGLGDQTSVYGLYSEGLRFGRLEQTFAVGNDGLRLGANASALDYEIVPGEFAALNGQGSSTSLGLQASYPLIRARQHNLYLDLNYDHRYFRNESSGSVASRYTTDDFTTALRANMYDQFGGGGNSNAQLGLVLGSLDLGRIDPSEDPSVNGGFQKVIFNVSRQQTLTQSTSVFAAVSGQLAANKKIDTSEKFYLGGANGVRAYPVNEGGGSSGALFNIEPRWNVAEHFQLSAFYDYVFIDNNDTSDDYSLKGAGLSLAWQSVMGANIKATWARRIGDNPNPTATGKDQDGSLNRNRFWLTGSMQF